MKKLTEIRSFGLLAILIVSLAASVEANRASAQPTIEEAPSVPSEAIRVLESNAAQLKLELTFPDVQQSQDGTLIAGELPRIQEAGQPSLPYKTILIALPPEGTATVQVTTGTSERYDIDRVPPGATAAAPAIDLDGKRLSVSPELESDGQVAYQLLENPDIYAGDTFFPDTHFSTSEPFYFRDYRLLKLSVYPYRYNPVAASLAVVNNMQVTVQFDDPRVTARPLNSPQGNFEESVLSQVINPEQAQAWRSLPATAGGPPVALPVGQDVYKISVNEDGIYEVSGADLAASGMNLGGVDPDTLTLIHRGQPVAYQFIGNSADGFDPSDRIRFYGWEFDGPRLEKQYINANVYWLWSGGSPVQISQTTNPGGHPVASNYRASVTAEPENFWFSTWTDDWENQDNEPDAWFWGVITNQTTINFEVPITSIDPAAGNAEFTAEFTSRTSLGVGNQGNQVTVTPNGQSPSSHTWNGSENRNVTGDISAADLLNSNVFAVNSSTATSSKRIYLNRITLNFWRNFQANSDQLIFNSSQTDRQYEVSGFTTDQSPIVWNISDPYLPEIVPMSAGNVSGGAGPYIYTFGSDSGGDFIVSNGANVLAPLAISRYVPPALDPAGADAIDWLAITHNNFIAAAQTLAAHRANPTYGGYRTHIVDVEDVINQFGYGLPLPSAIQSYLSHALQSWDVPPAYVTLLGDATINPKNLDCVAPIVCPAYWDADEPTYLITGLVFEDPFQGLIPSDTPFVLLSGNDHVPDMAIGRITARTASEANQRVNKIIRYEQNQTIPQSWMERVLMLADADDLTSNYFFCDENHEMRQEMPMEFEVIIDDLCLHRNEDDEVTEEAVNAVILSLKNYSAQGASLLSYRGHGAVNSWGGGDGYELISVDTPDLWLNGNKPFVSLSADCLDGYFALPGLEALSEHFLREPNNLGSATHWSSSGLGFPWQHTTLENAFYEAIFDLGLTAIGDAIQHAKTEYAMQTSGSALLYSFTLQGDPALQLFRPDLKLEDGGSPSTVMVGSEFSFAISVENAGVLPIRPEISMTLPDGITFVDATSSMSISSSLAGSELTLQPDDFVYFNDNLVINVRLAVDSDIGINQFSLNIQGESLGRDLQPGNEQYTLNILIAQGLYLPLLTFDG